METSKTETGTRKRPKAAKPRTAKPEVTRKVETVLEQLGPDFVVDGARTIALVDVDEVLGAAGQIRKTLHEGPLERYRREGELLLELLADYRHGDYRAVSLWTLAVATFALGYIYKPVDIIPDTLPRIGLLDDTMVLGFALAMLHQPLHSYSVWRTARELADGEV